MHPSTDVLICGAGAAGLTLAIELARRGVSFRLIEKTGTPFSGSRGKGIQPRTLEVFEDLGILDKAVAAGGPYPRKRSYRSDGSYRDADLAGQAAPTPAEPYLLPLMLPQFVTEHIMRERLHELGHRVEFGNELTGFEQDEHGVTARIAGPDGEAALHARYLIGADGGRSFVRKTLGIDFPGKTLGMRAIVADVALDGLEHGIWHQFKNGGPESMLSICTLAGTDLFQIQAPIPPDRQPALSAAALNALIAERTGRSDIVVQSVSWISDYQMHARLAERYRAGRVFLIGDAAHVHPPTGGQGLNTGIQDAYNLGWKLAAALQGGDSMLLDSYELERRPVAEQVLDLSIRLLDAAKRGEMERGREVQQLDIGYPDSPLSCEFPPRPTGLRAGQRAPDAPVQGAAGQALRLFQLFRGTHWTLLFQENRDPSVKAHPGLRVHCVDPRGDIVDTGGHFRNAYQLAPGECVLVRPDGYVGAIFGAGQSARLERYLASMGVTPLEDTPRLAHTRQTPGMRA